MNSVRAAVLHGIGDLRIENVTTPTPGPGEVLISVTAVGVCGSDTHYFTHGSIGRFVLDGPMVIGHEAAGVIAGHGPGVDGPPIGTRVAIEPGQSCGHCRYCRSGDYNLCPDMRFMATPPYDGAIAEQIVWPASLVFPLPDSMSDEQGALLEPLSVGLSAATRAGIRPGDRVLISGAGPVGLLTAEVAKAFGAGLVQLTDISDTRLALARDHGFQTRDVAADPLPDSATDFDVLIECSAAPGALSAGMWQLAPGGRAAMVGVPNSAEVQTPLPALHDRQISVTTIFRYANTWPLAMSLVDSGRVDLSGLITDRFPLAETEAALMAGRRSADTVKAVVLPQH